MSLTALLAVVVVGTGMTPVKVWREDPDGKNLVAVTNAAPRAAAGAFRIMSYNIRFGKGMDDVTDYKRSAARILSESPDFVCVQEIWNRRQFRELAGYLGMHGAFANSGGFLGNAVFSREKPLKCEAVELPYSKKYGRTLVICEYRDFAVASMHLDLDEKKRLESVQVVRDAIAKYQKPVFIAGDWNNWPNTPVLKGLKTFVQVISPQKDIHTWHMRTMNRRECIIDYIAVDKAHAGDFSVLRSYEIPDRFTSDHSPIAVDVMRAETIFIEAESFDVWGGWVNNTQFMDQMGSPYLIAHGMGKPVADAKTTFVAKGGRYNVWVRTKNWTSPWHPGIGAGTFNLIVNGEKLPNLLGCQGKGEWLWVKADDVTLKAGENTLALHDCDGFDGRVDAVVFTTEADSSAIRNGPRHPSVVVKPLPLKDYDLVVVGGGIAGICAAVSASRLGLSVALVHDRPVLGGNNSSEVRVHLGAYQNLPPYPRLGDVLAEFGPKKGGNAREAANYEDDLKMKVVKAEKNLDLFLNEHVNGVEKDDAGRIKSVRSVNTWTGVATVFRAANFADCTGDGTVGFLAGADFRMGREAKSETNEPDAPEKADMITMGASVQWYAGEKGKREEGTGKREEEAGNGDDFPIRPWMLKTINEENCSPHLRGDWWWETGLGRDQIAEGEYIRDYGLLVAYSNWAFVKNRSSKKDSFADKELKWVAYNAGRRESRRLLGDFILNQNHIRNRDFQPDGTCVATWTIDLHLPKTARESKFEGEPYQSNSLNEKIWPYPIPYRCFYSRNVPNLFMAGRDISVTHIALGTTRLMRTHGMMGEVVGMAATVCKKHNCNPRDVYAAHLDELKALMTKGVGDGKKHPRQDYNVQRSLDPDIKAKHAKSVNCATSHAATQCARKDGVACGFVTYEEYGAVGDGKTDDQKAIVAAHKAANEKGLPVRACDGRTYYIGRGAAVAVIKTDVDFGTSKFVIDDRELDDYRAPVFRVDPSAKSFDVKGVETLAAGQKSLGVKLPGPCLMEVQNTNVKQYIRYGRNQNNGTAQREMFLADASGAVDPRTPIVWDYKTVTGLKAHPVDTKTLVVRGGHFTTIANQAESKYTYHGRGIAVRRSNVRIEGVRHYVTGEGDHGAPYGSFVGVSFCADVTVSNCLFTAHKTYSTIGSAGKPVSMGSYDIGANNAVNVSFIDCRQTTDINDRRYWGLFGSNYCKNLMYDGCVFSRFDAHMGVANATVRNCELGYMGINAIGFGTFLVENTTVRCHSFFNLRSDYGSTWRGEFIVRNCTFVPGNGNGTTGTLVNGSSTDWHDFGYACEMPRRIVFDGLKIDDSRHPAKYDGPYVFAMFNGKNKGPEYVEKFPYKVTEEVVIRNVTTASGKDVVLSPNKYMFRNVKIRRADKDF